jgi:hypothetical protein
MAPKSTLKNRPYLAGDIRSPKNFVLPPAQLLEVGQYFSAKFGIANMQPTTYRSLEIGCGNLKKWSSNNRRVFVRMYDHAESCTNCYIVRNKERIL